MEFYLLLGLREDPAATAAACFIGPGYCCYNSSVRSMHLTATGTPNGVRLLLLLGLRLHKGGSCSGTHTELAPEAGVPLTPPNHAMLL